MYLLPQVYFFATIFFYPRYEQVMYPSLRQEKASGVPTFDQGVLRMVLDSNDLAEDEAALVRRVMEVAADARTIYLERVETMRLSERPPDSEIERLSALPAPQIEAMVVHAVLTPSQLRRWRKLAEHAFPPPRFIAIAETALRVPVNCDTYQEAWSRIMGESSLRGWDENCGHRFEISNIPHGRYVLKRVDGADSSVSSKPIEIEAGVSEIKVTLPSR